MFGSVDIATYADCLSFDDCEEGQVFEVNVQLQVVSSALRDASRLSRGVFANSGFVVEARATNVHSVFAVAVSMYTCAL